MEFPQKPKAPRSESIVPMINVVFLLLIFFLMTSQIVPPEPFEVMPPSSSLQQETASDVTLYLDKSGLLAFEDLRGDAAIAKAIETVEDGMPLRLRADAQMEAKVLAQTLHTLTGFGLKNVELVVVAP